VIRAAAPALLVLASPIASARTAPLPPVPLQPAPLQPADEIQKDDQLVQSIGWKLARANARFCARAGPGVGIMLQDARTFDDPALARAVYGLSGDIGSAAIAADGPAAATGLPLNATLTAIDGLAITSLPEPRPGHWDRQMALQDRLEQAVRRKGAVTLTLAGPLAGGQSLTISGQTVCTVRFLMDDSTGNAGANRDIVRIGRPMAEALGWDEAEVAALMAHEMAHAVLDHQTWLAHGGSTRKAEREADRLSVWLLANAGYDPQAAPRWIAKIGPRYQIGFLVSPSHGGWRTRARDMTAEIATMQAARAGSPEAGSQEAGSQEADWPRLFRREEGAPAMPTVSHDEAMAQTPATR
jgi:hypothetical protein